MSSMLLSSRESVIYGDLFIDGILTLIKMFTDFMFYCGFTHLET